MIYCVAALFKCRYEVIGVAHHTCDDYLWGTSFHQTVLLQICFIILQRFKIHILIVRMLYIGMREQSFWSRYNFFNLAREDDLTIYMLTYIIEHGTVVAARSPTQIGIERIGGNAINADDVVVGID